MATYTSQTMTTSNPRVNYRIVVNTLYQNIENNTSTINVQVQAWRNNSGYTTYGSGTCYCSIQGTQYSDSIVSSQKITQNSDTVLFNRDITVYHSNDGSCTLYLSSYISHDVFSSSEQSYNVVLPTIPRASQPTLSGTEFNIGDEITVYTNRVSSNFTHDVLLLLADGSYSTLQTGVTDSYVWQTGDMLYQQCPNSPTFSSSILVKTYNSGTEIGEKYVNFMARVTNSNPTCQSISYRQINETVASLVGNYTDIILTKSEILVTFSDAQAKNYAGIAKYYVQIGDKTFESTNSEFSVTDIQETKKIYGWVKDSRNFDSSASKAEVLLGNIYEYSQPAISNIQLKREDDVYANTYLSFTANVSEIIAKNSAYYIYWHSKQTDSDTWSDPINIVNHDNTSNSYSYDALIGEFSTDKNFNIELIIGDSFGEYPYPVFLQTSKPELSIRNNMIGINCVPITDNGMLQINGKSLLDLTYPVGSIYMSVSETSPETLFGGKWESINDTFLLCAGKIYTPGSTGGEATHTLTVDEMPGHTHLVHEWLWVLAQGGWGGEHYIDKATGNANVVGYDGDQNRHGGSTGGNAAHNNMPPYLAVYCWKRFE